MNLRDQAAAQHAELLAAETERHAAERARVEDKKARMADDSGTNTAVPGDKQSI